MDVRVVGGDLSCGPWAWAARREASPGATSSGVLLPAAPTRTPQAIVVRQGDRRAALALSVEGRGKCRCPVLGWLDEDTVAFTSNNRVLARHLETGLVDRVAEPTGLDPGSEAAVGHWAWLAVRGGDSRGPGWRCRATAA